MVTLLIILSSVELYANPVYQTSGGTSLRFFGNGVNDIDRVKIRIDAPERPADIGASDFTIEFWMMANPGDNGTSPCASGGDNWINGNTIIDRDIYGNGDHGDYGISLYGGVIAFGVNNGSSGTTLCGATNVVNSQWHHIALVRVRNTGLMQIYVDGNLDASTTGPTGNVSYRNGRASSWPNDPFIVIGAEKHDVGPLYPSFSGWVDEVRLSNIRRYVGNFIPPTGPFQSDTNTVGLYHFDEGTGDTILDTSAGGSHGIRRFGGSPAGPAWSTMTPFTGQLSAPIPISPTEGAQLTDTQPMFSWSPVAGASTYQLELSGDTGLIPPFTDVFETTATSFHLVNLLLPGTYTWRVRAINGSNQSEWSNPTRNFSLISPTGAAPLRHLFLTNTPRLTWGRVTSATGYQIQVATDAGFTNIVFDETVSADVLEIIVPAQTNRAYHWRVRALHVGASGKWSPPELFIIHAG